MVSSPHEAAAEQFAFLIGLKTHGMQLGDELRKLGATRVKSPERAKQADRSWGPVTLHISRKPDWPTVALEVGYSETEAQLRNDMKFWLNRSKGAVNIGISINIERGNGRIQITTWRAGMKTRNTGDPEPIELQRASMDPQSNAITSRPAGQNLTIPFSAMFLRPRRILSQERDYVFTPAELKSMARMKYLGGNAVY